VLLFQRWTDLPAFRCKPGGGGVSSSQQYLQLVGSEFPVRLPMSGRPLFEPAFRESLVTQPEALAVERKELDAGAASISKHKDGTGEGLLLESLSAQGG